MAETRRIGVVTTHPPGTGTLNEYGLHLVAALAAADDVEEVVVFVDDLPEGAVAPTIDGVRFVASWRFNDVRSLPRLVRAIRRERLDSVLWSLQFASFGDRRIPAALGLLAPFASRLVGARNIVLMHHLMETVDLGGAGFDTHPVVERITRAVGWVVTRLLLAGGRVVVTMPQYLRILRRRYRARNIAVVPHGTFDVPACDASSPAGPLQLLAFGKFGTYKRVEPLLDAARRLRAEDGLDVRVVVAGTDSPNAAGYLARMAERYPEATFTGYVAEEDVADVFRSAAVAVFPYTHTTGSSGVVHQAGSYARPLVMPDIGDFHRLVEAEGYRGEWFDPTDPTTLDDALRRLLVDPERRRAQGEHNHAVAAGLPMADIAEWYLAHDITGAVPRAGLRR